MNLLRDDREGPRYHRQRGNHEERRKAQHRNISARLIPRAYTCSADTVENNIRFNRLMPREVIAAASAHAAMIFIMELPRRATTRCLRGGQTAPVERQESIHCTRHRGRMRRSSSPTADSVDPENEHLMQAVTERHEEKTLVTIASPEHGARC